MKENRILYDWFSCTSKEYNVERFISRLGMVNCDWRTARGAHGYKDKLTFGGCSVHYNGSGNMGTWLEMSGEGCRPYESYGNDLWDLLFLGILQDDPNAHFTRLVVAFDDFTGILDINEIIRDTLDGNFISKSSYHRVTVSSDGNSCQFGKSDVVIRIYDKAAEQKLTDGTHWVRVEIQLRDDRAKAWIKNMVPFGGLFKSVLYNYLRFVEPNPLDLEHKSRWNMKSYWAELLGNAERITLYSRPGVDYDLNKLNDSVFHQYGNMIDCALSIYGEDLFLEFMRNRPKQYKAKYENLKRQYSDHSFRDSVRLVINNSFGGIYCD